MNLGDNPVSGPRFRLRRILGLKASIYILILISIVILIIFLFKRYPILLTIFTDQPKIRSFITQYGTLAPLMLISLQVLQIVFAPVPGHIIGFVAGYLFGAIPGTIYCMIGIFIGASIAFGIGRLFGRRLLKLFVLQENMQKFDNYIVLKGPFIIFVLLLIPFSPLGDIIYYLSGLTAIPFIIYIVLVLIARLPHNLVNNFIGAKAFTFTGREWAIFILILAIFALFFYINRKRIENIILRFVKLTQSSC